VTNDPGSGTPMSERMQSLLSSAVEDQHSEQRSLAAALDEVRAQISALAQHVAASREQPTQTDPAAVAALTVELRESMRRSSDRLDAVARMVAQRGEDIATLQGSLSALGEQLRAQGESVNSIATYLGERTGDDGSRGAALEQRLVTLQNDMTAVGHHVAGLTESAAYSDNGRDLASLAESVRTLDGRLAASSGEELDARIRSIIAGALVGTERRLAAHIDEAVLALAEAMLRRRPASRDAAPAEPPPAEQITEQPPVEPPSIAEPQQVAEPAQQPAAQPLVDPIPTVAQDPVEPMESADAPEGPPSQPPVEDYPAATAMTAPRTVDVTDPPVPAAATANGMAGSYSVPKVPAAWTTVMPEDDQRRRGWFRSRD
jgi:hypothetical protein